MITDKKLVTEFKTLLNDPYVYYCGEGMAFDKARSKTVEVVYNIPFCFSILGILRKLGYIEEVFIDGAKQRGDKDESFLNEYGKYDIVYLLKSNSQPVAAMFDCCSYIKFFGTKDDIELDTMVFDYADNKPFSRKSNLMLDLLKTNFEDEQLKNIIDIMHTTIKYWKEQDELYNMMY